MNANHGRTSRTRGANDRLLRVDSRMTHGAASLSERHAAPTAQGMRSYLAALICPFCGKGPFTVPLLHISKIHALSPAEVRDMAQLRSDDKITESDFSELKADIARRSGTVARATAQSKGRKTKQRQTKRSRAARASTYAPGGAIRVMWDATDRNLSAMSDLAARTEIEARSLAAGLRKYGAVVPRLRVREHQSDCAVTGCSKPYTARGLCHTHYENMRRRSAKP